MQYIYIYIFSSSDLGEARRCSISTAVDYLFGDSIPKYSWNCSHAWMVRTRYLKIVRNVISSKHIPEFKLMKIPLLIQSIWSCKSGIANRRILFSDEGSKVVYTTKNIRLTISYGVCNSFSGGVIRGGGVCYQQGYPVYLFKLFGSLKRFIISRTLSATNRATPSR